MTVLLSTFEILYHFWEKIEPLWPFDTISTHTKRDKENRHQIVQGNQKH